MPLRDWGVDHTHQSRARGNVPGGVDVPSMVRRASEPVGRLVHPVVVVGRAAMVDRVAKTLVGSGQSHGSGDGVPW
jgi:hypothetical protein